MEHKSRTKTESTAHANKIMKSAGYPAAKSAVHKHESHMHPGKPMTKLASGGKVKGPETVNIVIKAGGDSPKPPMPMMAPPPPGPPPMMPPKPPMAGPPPGGMPPGAGPMAKGGMVKVRGHVRRAKGGKCE